MSKNNNNSSLSVLDAVETLANIADLSLDREVGVAREHDIVIQNERVKFKTVQWLNKEDPDQTVELIREIFSVVHNYLKSCYENQRRSKKYDKELDGIERIMVLVGEAANKLDRYTTLFQQVQLKSIKDLKEYKHLQDFYRRNLSKRFDQSQLSHWILGLTKQTIDKKNQDPPAVKTTRTERIFVDLEGVKNDTEYELFFLRKETGERFYRPRLIRNMKLISDFSSQFSRSKADDPLINVKMWYDKVLNEAATEILRTLSNRLDNYFSSGKLEHGREMYRSLDKAIISLMMASNPRHLLRNVPLKCCFEYFSDFMSFLRETLKTNDYQRMQAYSNEQKDASAKAVLQLILGMCRSLYTSLCHYDELIPRIERVIEEAREDISKDHWKAVMSKNQLWSQLAAEYASLVKVMKKHPGGPLEKAMQVLDQGGIQSFDPLQQENLPAINYHLYFNDHKMTNVRLPSPTYQEYINKAAVIEEFKGFLWSLKHRGQKEKHLLINLQDRTSWKEHFRSRALEMLQNTDEYREVLQVVTIPKDTEFYNQEAIYRKQNQSDDFIQSFLSQIEDERSGFHFPNELRNELVNTFSPRIMKTILRVFFSDKNVLSLDQRLVFIELYSLFLEIKLLDKLQPDTFSLTCKDGIDQGACSSALLWVFMHLLQKKPFERGEIEHLHLILFGPALLIRERMLLHGPFHRIIHVIRFLEQLKEEWGQEMFSKIIRESFGGFFDHQPLSGLITMSQS